MSGTNLPYHLRVKKDIERRLFVEQLRLITKVYDLEEYAYIGMAGAFSEDFKLMKDRFNFRDFFSYEIDEKAYKRQKFNLPFSKTNYAHQGIDTFIAEYPEIEIDDEVFKIGKSILWLDYIGFEEKLLQDFSSAIASLENGSVIKITLQAHASNLAQGGGMAIQEKRVERVKDLLGENYFFSDVFEYDKMTHKKFPLTIYKLLKKISIAALQGTDTLFLPISSYVYQDGVSMITFTGIKIKESEKESFLEKTGLQSWEYGLCSLDEPLNIEVPFLSLKEKYSLDACFPDPPDEALKYFEDEELESYEKFHRFYPAFAKIF
jgi:hypothetical protein